MAVTTLTKFDRGAVLYRPAREGRKDRTEYLSETTMVNHVGSPGVPGHFLVEFDITLELSDGEIVTQNNIQMTAVLPGDQDAVPYRELESRGALQIARALGAVAQLIEEEALARHPETTSE